MPWLSPTSHVNQASWTNEGLSHNGDDTDYAFANAPAGPPTPPFTWSGYLEYGFEESKCQKIGIYITNSAGPVNIVWEISVYYDSGWHVIFTGTLPVGVFTEKTIGSIENVSKIRIRASKRGVAVNEERIHVIQYYQEDKFSRVVGGGMVA